MKAANDTAPDLAGLARRLAQARADEKQQVYDDYSALLAKSQQIYS